MNHQFFSVFRLVDLFTKLLKAELRLNISIFDLLVDFSPDDVGLECD